MIGATCRLTEWQLTQSEFEINIIHRAGVKHEAADALSRLKTVGKDHAPLEEEVPVFANSSKFLACAPLLAEPEFETIERPKGLFVPLFSEVRTFACITDNK